MKQIVGIMKILFVNKILCKTINRMTTLEIQKKKEREEGEI